MTLHDAIRKAVIEGTTGRPNYDPEPPRRSPGWWRTPLEGFPGGALHIYLQIDDRAALYLEHQPWFESGDRIGYRVFRDTLDEALTALLHRVPNEDTP